MNIRRSHFEGWVLLILMFFVWLPALFYWKESIYGSYGLQEFLGWAAIFLTTGSMLAVLFIVSNAIDQRDAMERRIEEDAKNWRWLTETNESLVRQLELARGSKHPLSE